MTKKNGRSTFIENGGGGAEVTPIVTDVAAAATVPSSFTSQIVLCLTLEMKSPLPEFGSTICEKLARCESNASSIPNAFSTSFSVDSHSTLKRGNIKVPGAERKLFIHPSQFSGVRSRSNSFRLFISSGKKTNMLTLPLPYSSSTD